MFLFLPVVLWSLVRSASIPLGDSNFTEITAGLKDPWFVKFYVPWCPHCKALKPTWDQLAGLAKPSEAFIGEVDSTKSPALRYRFGVKRYPTMLLFKDDQMYTFDSYRSISTLLNWVRGGYLRAKSQPLPDWLGDEELEELIKKEAEDKARKKAARKNKKPALRKKRKSKKPKFEELVVTVAKFRPRKRTLPPPPPPTTVPTDGKRVVILGDPEPPVTKRPRSSKKSLLEYAEQRRRKSASFLME